MVEAAKASRASRIQPPAAQRVGRDGEGYKGVAKACKVWGIESSRLEAKGYKGLDGSRI